MSRIGGHNELPAPQAEQIILAHDAMNPLWGSPPSHGAATRRDPWPPIARHLDCDSLHRIPQIHIALGRFRIRIETVETSSAHARQCAHAFNRQLVGGHFLPDLLVDSGFPVNACSIRCSSMRCKHLFKKSISNACWPIFRSNSATRFSSALFFPKPGTPVRVTAENPAASDAAGLD
jgi:hypothetical protein